MDFIIAVDGTAASGKGTIANLLSQDYALPYLDTGLLYRAVGHKVRIDGGDVDDAALAAKAAQDLNLCDLSDPALRSGETGEAASRVATHPEVRAALFARQQAFARQPGGAVLDGRDIATVIAPFAAAKLFVNAALETRAQRRWLQTSGGGDPKTLEETLLDLQRRDARDSGRSSAPLIKSRDSVLLDTTKLSISQAADAARRIVEAARVQWLSDQQSG